MKQQEVANLFDRLSKEEPIDTLVYGMSDKDSKDQRSLGKTTGCSPLLLELYSVG